MLTTHCSPKLQFRDIIDAGNRTKTQLGISKHELEISLVFTTIPTATPPNSVPTGMNADQQSLSSTLVPAPEYLHLSPPMRDWVVPAVLIPQGHARGQSKPLSQLTLSNLAFKQTFLKTQLKLPDLSSSPTQINEGAAAGVTATSGPAPHEPRGNKCARAEDLCRRVDSSHQVGRCGLTIPFYRSFSNPAVVGGDARRSHYCLHTPFAQKPSVNSAPSPLRARVPFLPWILFGAESMIAVE
ncbi:hypothetical protein D9756_010149 [Leucocoprinus leucothites]|uniref:Uncharacterized protein n=1 Tax=Leucocoprinus leucothites TaxID=201217 RepID=A0A8H5FTD2_9AGAR|nr:hypothetical protein D9756_010149 [Leucoagaricus leucothites]